MFFVAVLRRHIGRLLAQGWWVRRQMEGSEPLASARSLKPGATEPDDGMGPRGERRPHGDENFLASLGDGELRSIVHRQASKIIVVKQNSSSLGPVDELQNTQDLFNKRHLPPKQTFFSPRDVTSLRLPRISPRESVPIETRPLPSPCILAFFSSFCRPDRHATYAFVSFESPAQRLRSTGNVEGR